MSTTTRAALVALALLGSTVGAAACSSSSGVRGSDNLGTAPSNCADLATKFAGAVTGFGASDSPNIAKVFAELDKVLPANLQADAKVLASTFSKFAAVLAKYNGDMSKALADPDGKAAITAMGSEKAAAANAAIEHYFTVQCPQASS